MLYVVYIIIIIYFINNFILYFIFKFFKLGIGDWGLGIGDWGLGPIPNPHYSEIIKIFLNKYKITHLSLSCKI